MECIESSRKIKLMNKKRAWDEEVWFIWSPEMEKEEEEEEKKKLD